MSIPYRISKFETLEELVESSNQSSMSAAIMKGSDTGTERTRVKPNLVGKPIGVPLTSTSVNVARVRKNTYADVMKNKYLPKVQGKKFTIKQDMISRAHSLERIQ